MITKKHKMLYNSLLGTNIQTMMRGQTAIDPAAAMPQSQVIFILQKQAKAVSPTTIAAVILAAVRTSAGSNHWVKPTTMPVQQIVKRPRRI